MRIRTTAASLGATAATVLMFGAGSALAHDQGAGHGFRHGHHDALAGVVQSTNPSQDTATITLGGGRMHRDWGKQGSSTATPAAKTVTVSLSGATLYGAPAAQPGSGQSNGSTSNGSTSNGSSTGPSSTQPTTITAADVHTGDWVVAKLATTGQTARQDATSGTPVPVKTLIDFGPNGPSTGGNQTGGNQTWSGQGGTGGHHRHAGAWHHSHLRHRS